MAVKLKSMYKFSAPFLGGILAVQLLVTTAGAFLLMHAESTGKAEAVAVYDRQVENLVNGYLTSQASVLKRLAASPVESLNITQPGILEARVIPATSETPTNLSFTQQDMIRRAIASKAPVAPEASHQADGSLVYHQIAALKAGGLLLVTTPMNDFESSLKAIAGKGGVILRQQVNKKGESATLLSHNLSEGAAARASVIKVANPNWELLSQAPAFQIGSLHIVIGLMLLSLLATPVLGLFIVRVTNRKLEEDVEVLHALTRREDQIGALNFDVLQELWSFLIASSSSRLPVPGSAASSGIRTHDVAGIIHDAESHDGPVVSLRHEAPEVDLGAMDMLEVVEQGATVAAEPEALEFTSTASASTNVAPGPGNKLQHVYRDYDIRGNARTEITTAFAKQVGQAVATEALERGERQLAVGYDARLTSEDLAAALIEGICSTGCNAVNVGMVPSPVLYFAAKQLCGGSGIMVTASHNPAGDNGFKIMLANHTLAGDEIRALQDRIARADFAKGTGSQVQNSVTDDYLQQITDDILLARTFNIVVDAGNGVAGPLVVRMLEELGCTVSPLYCEPDGNFPHHDPDPCNPHNLEDLLSDVAISGADLGLAFDGDGDRVVVVTNSTRIVASDKLLMLFAREVLATQPGADIIFDVKCSRDLVQVITSHGGRPVMSKTGHSWLKAAVAETGAPLAGELSGHFIFNDRWLGFDDGLYAAARFLEILATSSGNADDLFVEFPERIATIEMKIPVSNEYRSEVMSSLLQLSEQITDGTVNTTDGLRIEYAHGWGLVRPSNTGAYLVARFEGNDEQGLEMVKTQFREMLIQADPMLLLPF
ncbi:MAG TPA: phosphomannomutase/phosphoglucomutase [Fluviicoccus sp.]|nr:phosphomannomutase/phosphoglucomutase [Fluviicoccus sp.]